MMVIKGYNWSLCQQLCYAHKWGEQTLPTRVWHTSSPEPCSPIYHHTPSPSGNHHAKMLSLQSPFPETRHGENSIWAPSCRFYSEEPKPCNSSGQQVAGLFL